MKPTLYLINGPLGAGKTTLLSYLLKQPEFAGARVIENEFASTSVDTETLHEHTKEIQTIAGVCICCSTGDELEEALRSLLDSPDPIIIEATGVANSLMLIQKLAASGLLEQVELTSAVFVIDGAEATESMLDEYRQEIAAADVVFVSKTDLISSDQTAELEVMLEARGAKQIQRMHHGAVDMTRLNGPSGIAVYFAELDEAIIEHDDVAYTILDDVRYVDSIDQLRAAWNTLSSTYSLRRMKGDVALPDSSIVHVEATPSQLRDTPSSVKNAQLVFIGQDAQVITEHVFKETLDASK